MMKNFRNIIIAVIAVSTFLGIYSCTDDKEYLKFTEGGEISYSAAIDSLKIFSGKNRVKVQGLIIGDPKVTEVRVYWNNSKDSISIPVNRTANIDTVTAIIDNLDETILNFVVKTFDDQGNSSIAVSKTVEVYGDRYIASLLNRSINKTVLINNVLTLSFDEIDLNSGVIGSEIEYTNTAGTLNTIFVDLLDLPDDEGKINQILSVDIEDFQIGSAYRYRTVFLPEEDAIDFFYTDYLSIPVLNNATLPFVADGLGDGRWGNLADWVTNDAAKNHDGYGGLDTGCCGLPANTFNMESGWGSPDIVNGKIHQVVSIEPGKYKFKVDVIDTNHTSTNDNGESYFVISKGNGGLPDVETIATDTGVVAYKRIDGEGIYIVDFTIDEATEISVGQLTNQIGGGGHYANIRSFEIIAVN